MKRQLSLMALSMLLLILPTPSASASNDVDARQAAQQVLASFDHEPSVLEVQHVAARYARVNPGAYKGWLGQSNWAYVLPEKLRGELLYRDEYGRDVRTTASSTGSSDLVTADLETLYRAQVEWRLPRMIFNPDKLKVSTEISKLVTRREEILTTVNKLYFARRQAQALAVLEPPKDPKKAIRLEMQIAGLTADLDALTGGWFSETVRQRVKAAKLRPPKKASKAVSSPPAMSQPASSGAGGTQPGAEPVSP